MQVDNKRKVRRRQVLCHSPTRACTRGGTQAFSRCLFNTLPSSKFHYLSTSSRPEVFLHRTHPEIGSSADASHRPTNFHNLRSLFLTANAVVTMPTYNLLLAVFRYALGSMIAVWLKATYVGRNCESSPLAEISHEPHSPPDSRVARILSLRRKCSSYYP